MGCSISRPACAPRGAPAREALVAPPALSTGNGALSGRRSAIPCWSVGRVRSNHGKIPGGASWLTVAPFEGEGDHVDSAAGRQGKGRGRLQRGGRSLRRPGAFLLGSIRPPD